MGPDIAKKNLEFCRLYSHKVDKTTGLRCNQTILLYTNSKVLQSISRRVNIAKLLNRAIATPYNNNYPEKVNFK